MKARAQRTGRDGVSGNFVEEHGVDDRSGVRELLQKRVVLGDGAMATMLHHSGLPVRTCYEELSLRQPELVRDVHLAYIRAGADVIQTNTFGGHRLGLARYGVEGQLLRINEAAVQVARQAAEWGYTPGELRKGNRAVYVFGTIGSTADLSGTHLTQSGEGLASLRGLFEEQLEVLLSAGVDGLILETFADLEELRIALEAVRRATDLPVVATLSPDDSDYTRDGVPIPQAFEAMRALGADVVGLNCRLGLTGIHRAYEHISLSRQEGLFAAVPNAGLLHLADGEYSYTGSADYFAEMGLKLAQQGVRWIGGCCGTTPAHIRKLAERLRPEAGGPRDAISAPRHTSRMGSVGYAPAPGHTPAPRHVGRVEAPGPADSAVAPESYLLQKVREKTTIIVELDPPRTTDISRYMAGARALHDAGVDAITLADNSLGTVRVSNMALAALLKPLGINPLVHVTCRDRNLIGQQSHLMGLNVLGIHHILLVTGDPSRFGDLPGATSVYDVSSIDLTRMVKKLNEGFAFSGRALKHPAKFVVGTSFNPHVRNFDKAIDRLKRKIDAGADYVMTQPVYDVRLMETIATATEGLGVPVFLGIMPLVSSRNALYIHHEVPGIQVTDGIMKRMVDASLDSAAEVGMEIAEGLTTAATEYFNGIYLVTPFLRYELCTRLTNYIHGASR